MQPPASSGPSPRDVRRPPTRSARAAAAASTRTPASAACVLAPAGPVEQRVGRRRGRRVEDRLAAQRVVRDRLRGPEAGRAGRLGAGPAQEPEPLADLGRGRAGHRRPRRPAALVAVEQAGRQRAHRCASTAVSDGTIAATLTPFDVEVAERGERLDGAAPPRDVGVVLEAVGRRDTESVRDAARATTLPSPSAAIAFTDDVPMSMPTVTSGPLTTVPAGR